MGMYAKCAIQSLAPMMVINSMTNHDQLWGRSEMCFVANRLELLVTVSNYRPMLLYLAISQNLNKTPPTT